MPSKLSSYAPRSRKPPTLIQTLSLVAVLGLLAAIVLKMHA